MDKTTATQLIEKLWTIGESLKQIQSALDQIEYAIADEINDDTQ